MGYEFLDLFTEKKPVIGVIHMKGTVLDNVMSHAKKEIKIYLKYGVDGILFDNYSGNYHQLEAVLGYAKELDISCPIGVHVLHVDALSFHLAKKFSLDFLQVDSVVGQGTARDEHSMQVFFDLYRETCSAKVIGGLGLAPADLQVAMTRYDAIELRGTKELKKQMQEKMRWFRKEVESFPLILSDTTEANFMSYINLWDVAIIDTLFKEPQKRNGNISEHQVEKLMGKVQTYRAMCV